MSLPWTDDSKVPDVKLLTTDELLDLFLSNRNGMLAIVASAEVCLRLIEERGSGNE